MIYRNSLSRLKYFIPNNAGLSKVWGQNASDRSENGLRIYYSGFARQTLFNGLDLLRIDRGDNVLVPAYICDTAIEPFALKGIEVRYYNINRDFFTDTESLTKLVDSNTKALLYVNYFGLVDEFKDYQSFCRNKGLYIIEDNAHTLLSDYRHIKGDISIFSLRKFYPVPNGALLVVKNSKKLEKAHEVREYVEEKPHLIDYKFAIGTLCRRVYNCVSGVATNMLLSNFKKIRRKSISQSATARDRILYERVLASSFNIINNTDFQAIFSKRRDNYDFLLEKLLPLDCKYVKVIFSSLGTDSCPLAFPILVEKDRKSFIKYLFSHGYAVYQWPDLPGEIKANCAYKNEHFLSNSIILLPIHQDITRDCLKKMAVIIKEWVSKIDNRNS